MTQTELRLAVPHDLAGLAELARTTFEEAFSAEMEPTAMKAHLREKMSNDTFSRMMSEDHFTVAEAADCLIGFVQVGQVNPDYAQYVDGFDHTAGEVRRLYVRAERQQKGLGSDLLTQGLAAFSPHQSVYITTWESNLGAQKLYRKFGFSLAGKIPEYGSGGDLNGYEHIMFRPA